VGQKNKQDWKWRKQVGIKQMVAVLGLVFAVTLAVIVGRQMTTEAMAVVVGVVCGVAAGIPTAVLLLVAMTRRDSLRSREDAARQAPANYPPVVVIQGGGMQPQQPALTGGYWPAPSAAPLVGRQFHVVGGDELLLDDDRT
jgi:hypothetical protein